ncbi:Succinyl-CoA ligase [ADP-forming] beta chain [Euzebya pacifica]|uniref:Succinate--CoA ligase [ADP-forming] subunit beta n=1 Tax=Euzebya pacifica TaxID=1608957 RepID=A0A346XTG9_9ACTN|nr:Succinyl-CoA ligase [ADP-forming] beta chain [Euzebya pacifica]
MDLMEFQGKDLFRAHGIPTTPQGQIATTPEQAEALATEYGVPVMVKAQVLTGGRGKAGGVKYCPDAAAAKAAAEAILGLDIKGHVVHKVLVEKASDIGEEYYLSILHDRVSKGYKAICSVEGGVEIEEVNRTQPDKVAKVDINPVDGMSEELANQILDQGAMPTDTRDQQVALLMKLYDGFVASDATLFEINPLIKTEDGRIIALDSKVSLDDNALFRHEDLAALEGPVPDDQQGDDLEARAKDKGLQYVKLDGDIGIMGNGAGLVMSTLDVVSQAGGEAANFLDAGGGASAESMAEGIAFVLGDPAVKVMLINIFGGITRCDDVANGVLGAMEMLGDVEQKLVVRLDGNSAEEGRRILEGANNPKIVPASQMIEAAEKAVALAKEA